MEHDAYEQLNKDTDLDKEIADSLKRFDKAQNSLENYMEAKEIEKEVKEQQYKPKRKFFDLSPNISNLEGNTIIERLGYDKDAKTKAKKENKPNLLEKKITDKNLRMTIYVIAIVLMVLFIILHHTFFK